MKLQCYTASYKTITVNYNITNTKTVNYNITNTLNYQNDNARATVNNTVTRNTQLGYTYLVCSVKTSTLKKTPTKTLELISACIINMLN